MNVAIAVFVKTPGLTPLKTRLAATIGSLSSPSVIDDALYWYSRTKKSDRGYFFCAGTLASSAIDASVLVLSHQKRWRMASTIGSLAPPSAIDDALYWYSRAKKSDRGYFFCAGSLAPSAMMASTGTLAPSAMMPVCWFSRTKGCGGWLVLLVLSHLQRSMMAFRLYIFRAFDR